MVPLILFDIPADFIRSCREHPASEVYVTGTFDDWGKTVKLDKKGDNHHEKLVQLPNADETIYYKVSPQVVSFDAFSRSKGNSLGDEFAWQQLTMHYSTG